MNSSRQHHNSTMQTDFRADSVIKVLNTNSITIEETEGQNELGSLVAHLERNRESQLHTEDQAESKEEIYIQERYAVQTDPTNIPYENETERFTCQSIAA